MHHGKLGQMAAQARHPLHPSSQIILIPAIAVSLFRHACLQPPSCNGIPVTTNQIIEIDLFWIAADRHIDLNGLRS